MRLCSPANRLKFGRAVAPISPGYSTRPVPMVGARVPCSREARTKALDRLDRVGDVHRARRPRCLSRALEVWKTAGRLRRFT
jgi:hypothetical protein